MMLFPMMGTGYVKTETSQVTVEDPRSGTISGPEIWVQKWAHEPDPNGERPKHRDNSIVF